MSLKNELTVEEKEELLATLETRFNKHEERHEGYTWNDIKERLNDNILTTVYNMEVTEGEPDVVSLNDQLHFVDCSKESPKGRRSICYDRAALNARKKHKPENSAIDLAEEIGIQMLSEEEFRQLNTVGDFDLKSSSWVLTPQEVRELGGAYFCDKRYNQVFLYHNGADSYYAARGFRGKVQI